MGPFLLVLLVSSGVSVFSLAPEPSDDEVSSTSSLVSRLSQVKTLGMERRGRHQTVGKERRGRHQYFLFYDTPPSFSPSPTTESQPLIVHHVHYHNHTTVDTEGDVEGTDMGGTENSGSQNEGNGNGNGTGNGGTEEEEADLIIDLISGGNATGGSDYSGFEFGSEYEYEYEHNEGSGGRTCECGALNPNTKIIGGGTSRAFVFRWLVTLSSPGTDGRHPGVCGGTLIASRWVLTAAHCVQDCQSHCEDCQSHCVEMKADNLSVVIGEHRLYKNDGSLSDMDLYDTRRLGSGSRQRKNLKVDKIILHEEYIWEAFEIRNDIALLKLEAAVDLNDYPPACLPSRTANAIGKTGFVAGWGRTPHDFTGSKVLQHAKLRIISNRQCDLLTHDPMTNDMMCAMTPPGERKKGSCRGDSGGPLTVVRNGDHHILIGVVSGSESNCTQDGDKTPGVYSSVPYHLDWIKRKMESEDGTEGGACQAIPPQ